MTTPRRCDTIALEVIACPFCFCSCCRWQRSSARRAASNNPRPGSVRGFFYALIAAGRPRSPQEPPSAPQSFAPALMYARRPSRPVCARSRAPWACLCRSGCTRKIYRAAHNAPARRFERLLYPAYIRQGQRVCTRPAPVWRALRCRARCAVSHAAPAPAEEPPQQPKNNPPEGEPNSGRISERVFIRFLRGFGRESRSAYTRLIVAGIVA